MREFTLRSVGIGWWIAAQGHQVFDVGRSIALKDFGQLGTTVRHADEMRHRFKRGIPLDFGHEVVGALPRLCSPAIGHRHKGRVEGFEFAQRRRQGRRFGVRLWREEFETDGLALSQQRGDRGHCESQEPARPKSSS